MAQLETFLDVLLIEEIPVEDAQGTGIVTAGGQEIIRTEKCARKPMYGKVIACDKQFPRFGMMVEMPYKVGDVVKTNEFGRNYVTFSVEDELPGAKKYYLIRYDDIEGRLAKENPKRYTLQEFDAELAKGDSPFTITRREPQNAS